MYRCQILPENRTLERRINPKTIVHERMTFRAPYRSTRRPIKGLLDAAIKLNRVKANEIAPRLAWNSRLRGIRNTPNANGMIGAAPRNSPSAAVRTTHHP